MAGRHSEHPVAEFGERVTIMAKGPKKEMTWPLGVWLGFVPRSHEVYLEMKEGTVRAWTGCRVQLFRRYEEATFA